MESNTLLPDLIQRLRLYRPPSSQDDSNEEEGDVAEVGNGEDLDERGKVFSQVGLVESAAVPPLPRPERFKPKRAAVLICIFEGERGDLRVLLTKRSSTLSTHSGEVSLPGGKAEESDADDGETAMREAKEEIGLDPALVTVVACLEPFLSRHLLIVIPVIGVLSNKQAFEPVINASEVETMFDAPLEMFLKDENHRSKDLEWLGEKFLVHYFDFETGGQKFLIWGLTAGILIHAATVVYQRPTAFIEQKPKFRVPRHLRGNCSMP